MSKKQQSILEHLPPQVRAELEAQPPSLLAQILNILATNSDGRGRRGELFTPTGAGRHR